jgi:ClpP class serine protease
MHTDTSGAEEKAGIKRTVISAGRYKGEAAPGVPLTDEALAAKQAMVSEATVCSPATSRASAEQRSPP